MVEIKQKKIGDIITGYFGYFEDKVVFLDLSTLDFYPTLDPYPSIVSWEGFNESNKFNIRLMKEDILDKTEEEIFRLIEGYLTS